ncbi:tRNA (adenosine(37)-N6)-dimethylallyltransferase MiaA [Allosphingosinicella deserti]|uniref:tRNA dimethylallyltransferase n=1 Tax=Allosphingosinicella deserti TaxID=2116704 RepID=A0A2P7QHF6_9SPHN|nr:tRNA (adenosine(37)-N6)-dimethylallyltransferase MiaA [Sphingomonas deserti]PSJ37401.1 tRNA (adenosine(37)-N6)-dimethylallyltransferase MiaA [Sphingomonas deserti]
MNISSLSLPSSALPRVALIAGPTASGKSALALRFANRVAGTIVNADSAQVYRDLRIVSARPLPEEEALAPHRLYGTRDGAIACSAADWAEDAKREIEAVHAQARIPVLVGGTGFYVRTLLEGIAPIPPIDPAIREAVRALPVESAYQALVSEDFEAAARLGPSDTTRVARALEVVRSTGKPLGEWQQARAGGIAAAVALRPLILLPPRAWLYERCDQRFENMMSNEGLNEISLLLARDFDPMLPVMRAIGVREIAAYLRGDMTRDQALEAGRRATRHYAKRQYTWFAHQSPIDWPRWTEPLTNANADTALALLGLPEGGAPALRA